MAKISYDDGPFSDLTPEEFRRVKAFGDRMLKEAMAQKGKGHRVQVGTLFGCPIYLDESVPDGEFMLEPAPAGDALPSRIALCPECEIDTEQTFVDGYWTCQRCGVPHAHIRPSDGDERRAVGAALIAWAADEGNVILRNDVLAFEKCILCPQYYKDEWGDEDETHAPDCLHVAARKLQEASGES